MAYDEGLAERIRDCIPRGADVAEKKMFGGIAFLDRGNMACGVVGDTLMLRLGNEGTAEALREPHTRAMDFTGRVLKSMLYVDPEGIADDSQLRAWVERAFAFSTGLPGK